MSDKKGMFDWYFKTNLLVRILLGLILGAIVGLVGGESISWLKPLGDIFVRLLKMIVMPVVLSTLVVGAASISPAKLGKIGIKAVAFYMVTSAFAVAVGLLMGNLFRPGLGLNLGNIGAAAGKVVNSPSLADTFLNIIPKNPLGDIVSNKILPSIFFAIIFGIALSYLKISKDARIKKAGDVLFSVFDASAEVMYLIVRWVMQYAPVGVFALIAVVFGQQGLKAMGPLGTVTMAAFTGYVLQVVVVYVLIAKFSGINPFKFLTKIKAPMITAFVTRSSSGTLPVSMKTAEEDLGIHKDVYSFSLPLGATINMDGTAIYQGVCAMFIGFAVGMPLSLGAQITVILTAVLASIGTAGVPGAGAIMLMLVLESIGMPLEAGSPVAAAYAMILGIDAILDMGRTCINVTGDMTCSTIIAKSEGLLDKSKWN